VTDSSAITGTPAHPGLVRNPRHCVEVVARAGLFEALELHSEPTRLRAQLQRLGRAEPGVSIEPQARSRYGGRHGRQRARVVVEALADLDFERVEPVRGVRARELGHVRRLADRQGDVAAQPAGQRPAEQHAQRHATQSRERVEQRALDARSRHRLAREPTVEQRLERL
jgi:hypothetical protein